MEGLMEYWYLMPISIIIATIAMSSGIGGAVFFSPLFLIVLGLEPAVAIGAALITEFFGFSSGLAAYSKAKLIDYKLGKNLLMFSVPLAIAGALVVEYFNPNLLKSIFAVGIIFIGWQLFVAYKKEQKEKKSPAGDQDDQLKFESQVIDRDGNVYRYTVCEKNFGRALAAVGGFFLGMISVGLAELQEYQLVGRCKVPTPVAVATSIFVVVITVLVASIGHIYNFAVSSSNDNINLVLKLVIFTVPGVIIGGQLGPILQKKANPDFMKIAIATAFVVIGIFLLATLLL